MKVRFIGHLYLGEHFAMNGSLLVEGSEGDFLGFEQLLQALSAPTIDLPGATPFVAVQQQRLRASIDKMLSTDPKARLEYESLRGEHALSFRVVQVISIPDTTAQPTRRHTELDVELASTPRRTEDAPPPKAEPITSYDDLVLRSGDAMVVLESSRPPSPQERVNAFRTVALLRDFALIHLQRMGQNHADEAVRISGGR